MGGSGRMGSLVAGPGAGCQRRVHGGQEIASFVFKGLRADVQEILTSGSRSSVALPYFAGGRWIGSHPCVFGSAMLLVVVEASGTADRSTGPRRGWLRPRQPALLVRAGRRTEIRPGPTALTLRCWPDGPDAGACIRPAERPGSCPAFRSRARFLARPRDREPLDVLQAHLKTVP